MLDFLYPIQKKCESSNCLHCHLISSTDVSTAVSKLKTDKALKTCNYQFGFKSKSSTVHCSTMVNKTVQYYAENDSKPLFDGSKTLNIFDKVAFIVLFNELRDRSMCPLITKLLHHMYTN